MNRSVLRGIVLIILAIGAIAALILLPNTKPKPKAHPPNNDPWVLVNYDPNTQYGTYLGNGYISTRIMGDGVGRQCFMAGLYDKDRIVATPNWAALRFYDGKTQFIIDKDAPYKQTLDMRTGMLTTQATWRAGEKTLTGSLWIVVSRGLRDVCMLNVRLVPNFEGSIQVVCGPRGAASTSLEPARLSGGADIVLVVSRYDVGTARGRLWTVGAAFPDSAAPLPARRGQMFQFLRWVGLTTAPDSISIKKAVIHAASDIDGFWFPNKFAMSKLWQHDIIIDGPVQDQQAVHACMFYLMQSVREGSQTSIPPMGLSSDWYQGHIFWDADIWMFPALILQHPELAKSIVDYRYNTLKGAMANAKAEGFQGAQYAWESAVTGSECTPKGLVYRNERHIDGDVALAQWQYYLATGDLNWLKTRGYPVIKATADWWVSKAKYVPEKKRYEILQVVSPDENADLVDNSAYTNAIAAMNLRIASEAARLTHQPANPKWADVAGKLYIPYDIANKRFIAHDGYRGQTAKQADTELMAYPLQFQIPGTDMTPIYRNTLDYYAPKVHKNGPAMTSSAHSIIAARLGLADRAYADFQRSYQPYFREPFCTFNEKASRTFDNTCFLTGAAGPIQAAVFGLAGARIDYFPKDPANAQLSFHPCLPKSWNSLTIKGVHWHGKTFDVVVTQGNKVRLIPTASGG